MCFAVISAADAQEVQQKWDVISNLSAYVCRSAYNSIRGQKPAKA